MEALQLGDPVDDASDLVDRLDTVTADLELDERCVTVRSDLTRVVGSKWRANVLNGLQLGDPRDDVVDRGSEGGILGSQRAALDQDVLAGRVLEAVVQDPVHAAGLAGACCVRVDVLHADDVAEPECEKDEGEPAERSGLPVSGAPASHAGRVVLRLRKRGHACSFRACRAIS